VKSPRLRRTALVAALAIACIAAFSCTSIAEAGSKMASEAGLINKSQVESIKKGAAAVDKTFEDITPEQEYYIGRAVGATILSGTKPWKNAAASRYLNLLGQTLAAFSEKPETFGGYHFLILDSADINAFAAPGGLIFVSRGMLRLCDTEAELAAVLAHEIAHVQFGHGLKAIKADRLTSAFGIIGSEAAKQLTDSQLKEVTGAFTGSVTDVTKTMVNSGYSQVTEFDADKGAVNIMLRAGYAPAGLVSMLERMKTHLKPGAADFAKTHPDPDDRIARIKKMKGTESPGTESPAAKARRVKAMTGA